ncbi:MAG TPA: ATP-binding cassette domain-containing protein [Flavisolibacter sp.]|jgi:ABC-type multidrug transport system ATPase subunit|nr:ATP-binding cassette domain-containing protein [Flavisolibacter sp.]
MTIRLSDCGKRFNREWIFRHATVEFSSGKSYAITGANGSGKSTFLQTVGALLQPSEGGITYERTGSAIAVEDAFQYLSFCAPYLEVVEEMTLIEFLQFHADFKPFLASFTPGNVIDAIGLRASVDRPIRDFSSGMKQRVKLAQAIFSDTGALLLDEPCTNLDEAGIALYHSLIQQYCTDRIVIVCSNDKVEFSFCTEIIEMASFK